MKVKSTKSALLMSFTSLLLCFAMLIGSTFAWFTDSVTSGVNQIKAGNLDVEVEYSKDGTNWANLQGSASLFTGALWEPGHTEVVYLRVKNAGTLALKYDLKVSPVSESGGINQEGNSFKLSDYIKFATVSADTLTTYTRETARTAVGEGVALNSGLLQSGELQPKAASAADLPTKYVTLVVYMPEDVGNVANYKTGTTAPEIDLGITVLATQLKSEADSFGNTYDDGLTNDISVVYNYFPQVNVTGQLKISGTEVQKGDENTETTVQKISEAKSKVTLASSEKVEGSTAAKVEAVLEKGTLADQQTGSMTLKVVKDDTANANFQSTNTSAIDTTKQDSTTYKVEVETEGVVAVPETEGKAKFKVDLFIGKSRTNVKMYHSGTEMTEAVTGANNTFTYNATTGYVTMYVDSFSPFTAVYDMPVAAIGTTAYYSLESAVAAAKAGETVVLLKDCAGNGIKVLSGKNFTIDFNGFTYNINGALVGSTGTETQAFQLLKGSTLTFKNGTLTSNKARILIQNYCNLTLSDMTIEASGSGLLGAVSNNCGKVDIIGKTSITVPSNMFAVDAMYWPDGGYPEGTQVTINTTGTIDGMMSIGNNRQSTMGPTKLSIVAGNFVNYGVDTYGNATDLQSAYTITGGTFSSDPSKYVKSGYEAVASGNVWTIEKVYAAQIGDTKYVTLEEALSAANDGDTVTLLTDVTKTNATGNVFTISKSITLDGNDKKITITGNSASRGIQLKANGGNKTATIKNLTIETTGVGKTIGFDKEGTEYTFGGTLDNVIVKAQGVGVHTKGYADVEIKNCKISITTKEGKYTAHNRSGVSAGPGQTTTISNTNVTVTATDRADNDKNTWGKAIYVGYNNVENGGKVVINSGEIKGDFALAIDGTKADNTGKPTTSTNTIIANGGHYTGAIGSPSGYSWKELYLKGGTFDELAVAAHGFGTSKEDISYLEITGGTFSAQPDAKYIANGYTATESSGVWTVSKQPNNP